MSWLPYIVTDVTPPSKDGHVSLSLSTSKHYHNYRANCLAVVGVITGVRNAAKDPSDFDKLDMRDVAQFVCWIQHQYYVVFKSSSGNHLRFEDRVGEKGYLLYFHNMVTDSGAQNVESMMKAKLNEEVFAQTSSVTGAMAGDSNQEDYASRPSLTPTAASRKRTVAVARREQTDQAFMRLMEMLSSPAVLSAAARDTSAAKDSYIEAERRIAIEQAECTKVLHDIAVGKEISDAVDVHLKKWKESLKELENVEQDFGIDHALYKATKATSDMHQCNFNQALQRATKQDEHTGAVSAPPATLDFQ
jgi:DNA-binding TFAR19-related protein (PDSD5 family)